MLARIKLFTAIRVNKVAKMLLISVVKTSNELTMSCIIFTKYKVQQHIIPFLEVIFIFNTLSLSVCQNFFIHQFMDQQEVWINHFLEMFFQTE